MNAGEVSIVAQEAAQLPIHAVAPPISDQTDTSQYMYLPPNISPHNRPTRPEPPVFMSTPAQLQQQPVQQPLLNPVDVHRVASLLKSMLHDELAAIIEETTAPLKHELNILRNENNMLQCEVSKLQVRVDDVEQYSRRLCVRVSNFTETHGENTDQLILNVAKDGEANISLEGIDRSHRVGPNNDGKPRDIIVKFRSYPARSAFLKCKKKLREKKTNIYINEDLTKSRNNLAYECRKLKKDSSCCISDTWVCDGKIFIKTTRDTTSTRIYSLSDLDKYRAST